MDSYYLAYSIIALFNILAMAVLTAVVIGKDRRNVLNQIFALACFYIALWLFSHYARYATFPFQIVHAYEEAFYWGKVSQIAASFGILAFVYFFIIFPDRRRRLPHPLVSVSILVAIPLFYAFMTLQGAVVSGMDMRNGKYYIVAGPAFPLMTLLGILVVTSGIYLTVMKMRRLVGLQRLQAKYVFLGANVVGLFGLLGNTILPLIIRAFPHLDDLQFLYSLAPLYATFFVYFTAYAILKHRLMDIELVISRSAGYGMAVAIVIGIYMVIVSVVEWIMQNMMGYGSVFVSASTAMVIAFLFHPLQVFFQNAVYNKFFARRFAYQAFLLEASRSVVTILNREELIEYLIEIVQKYIGTERVSFLLRSDEEEAGGGHEYYIQAARGVKDEVANTFSVRNGLISWFQERRQVFVKDELEFEMEKKGFSKLYGQLDLIGADLMVPVFTKDKLAGILALDRKLNGRTYSQQDIDILNILSAEVGVAIDNARLYGEAITDQLTGMFNRRYFDYRLNEEILRAQRYHRPLSLLMLDLDHFKQVNDTHGHPAGDFVLRQITRVIRATLRQTDILCRYGGEEIAIILPETGEQAVVALDSQSRAIDDCRSLAERIRREVAGSEFLFGHEKIPVTVSIGMAYYPDVASQMVTPAEIISEADRALYQAKESGRNCVKGVM